MDSGLRDKSVLVTGASGGIGQSIVRVMVEEGAKVAIHYHSGVERAQSLANSLPESQVELVGADLTSESDVAGMFDAVTNRFGTVDVLVANAGKWPEEDTPIHEMSLERWNDTFAVNSTSVFLCVREFMKAAVASGGTEPALSLIHI